MRKIFCYFKKIDLLYLLFVLAFLSFMVQDSYADGMDQQMKVSGKVTDSGTGQAMPGVNIVVKGTMIGAITDTDGKYSITLTDKNAVLVFSFIGYISQEVPVNGKTTVDVALATELKGLDEVVVVGYGTQKRTTLTGSVSSIKTEKIAVAPVSNISSSIAGKVAGVSMTQSSGQPGKNNPTLYIRGVGTTGNRSALIVVDGIPNRSMTKIDPENIESISILKDAAAIAPFGLGGANGVILITTKSGSKDSPMRINLDSQYGWQSPTIFEKVLSAKDFMLLANEAYLNDNPTGTKIPYDPAVIADYDNLHASDPDLYPIADYDQLFRRNIPLQKHHLEFSGGSNKIAFNAGFRYYKEEGMFDPEKILGKELGYSRINYNINLKFDVTNTTKISLQALSSIENTDDVDAGTSSTGSATYIFYTRYIYPAVKPLYYSNGKWGQYNQQSGPAYLNSGGYQKTLNDTRFNTITVEQQLPFIQGLSIKGAFSYDKSVTSFKGLHKPFNYWTIDYNTTPYTFTKQILSFGTTAYSWLNEQREISNTITAQGFINYARDFGKNTVTGLFVTEARKGDYNIITARRQKFPVDVDELSMGSSDRADFDNSGTSSQSSQLSYVYRVGYDYADKYLLEAAGRYDGHYYFAPDRKWGFFPSFSVGWRLSQENFMKNLDFINNLKVRGSWGQSGNLAGSAFQYLSGYYLTSNYAFGNGQFVTGAYTNLEANPLITWEEAVKTDVGFEASLWNSLLTIEADIFKEERSGMLLPPEIKVPVEYGISLAQENAGVMRNHGFELTVGSDHAWQNGLRLGVMGNFSFANNKMIQIFESGATFNNPNRRRTGRPYQTPFGYHMIKFFSTEDDTNGDGKIDAADGYNIKQVYGTAHPGDPEFADVSGPDGTPDGKVDSNDEVVIGYPSYPGITYGLTLSAAWKGFDLDLFFQGSSRQSMSTQWSILDPFNNNLSTVLYEYYDNRWTPETQNTATYPRAQFGRQWQYATDMFMRDVTFMRLKTGSIGYTLPASLTKPMSMQSVRLYLITQNILTLSNLPWVDPQTGVGGQDTYPMMKTYSIGLNVVF